jgi:nitrogen fixation NifU-like protein
MTICFLQSGMGYTQNLLARLSSIVSEMAMGKTLSEAKKITKKSVADSLDGLPKEKMHCSNLGADALTKAIEDFENKQLDT